MLMMQEEAEQIGRFKVRRLMRELELASKQPGSHAYKKATVERPDMPNVLNQEFDVEAPNQVWCGDITYIWAQGKWHYLAVVMDLYPCCWPGQTPIQHHRISALKYRTRAAPSK